MKINPAIKSRNFQELFDFCQIKALAESETENVISIDGVIGWDVYAKDIEEKLSAFNGKPVRFDISSPGGFVFEGLKIFNLIRNHNNFTECRIVGLAASMASYIALAGDRTTAFDNVVYMIHNARMIAAGDHRKLRDAADILDRLSLMLAQAYIRKTGKSEKEIRKMMDNETFLFGDEMKKEGFVDEIIETGEAKEKNVAFASANETIKECLSRMSEMDEAKKDIEKVAAIMKYHENQSETFGNMDFENSEVIDPENPYPNEHACRVREPGEFERGSFRRISRESEGKKFDIIIGRPKGKDTTATQAFRYPKNIWTVAQARSHCDRNNGKSFEPAEGESKNGLININQNPASTGNFREVNNMTLNELLAQNPAAKIEHEKALDDARKAGFETGQKEINARIEKAAVFIGKDSAYPETIKALAIGVIKGEKSIETLEASIIVYDANREQINSEVVQSESAAIGNTPAQQNGNSITGNGQVKNEADVSAVAAELKSHVAGGV